MTVYALFRSSNEFQLVLMTLNCIFLYSDKFFSQEVMSFLAIVLVFIDGARFISIWELASALSYVLEVFCPRKQFVVVLVHLFSLRR